MFGSFRVLWFWGWGCRVEDFRVEGLGVLGYRV